MNWTQTSAVGDQMALRRHNLGIVLRHLRDDGSHSRAQIAAQTGLNKATVSSLATELLDRGLVRAGTVERGAVGRPGRALQIDGAAACGVGAEINVDRLSAMALDLGGEPVAECSLGLDVRALSPEEVLDRVATLVREVLDVVDQRGATPVGIGIGVAGLVRSLDGSVSAAPNLGWSDVAVGQLLADRLGRPSYPVHVDNEANLAAVAESVGRGADSGDLIVLTGEVGLGGGVLSGGRVLRGRHGFAGEIGHLRVDPNGVRCGCGRVGCWETLVGLRALLALAADPDDTVHDPALDLPTRLAELGRRATLGDARTVSALHQVGRALGTGAAALVNVLNPGVIVLSGYFAHLGEWLVEPMETAMAAGAIAPQAGGCRVELSQLGVSAVVRGGALSALELVYSDPTVVPRKTDLAPAGEIR